MSVVVDIKVMDKRETKWVSIEMERKGLRQFQLRCKQGFDIYELVTNASFVMQKLVKDLKGTHSFNLFCNVLM